VKNSICFRILVFLVVLSGGCSHKTGPRQNIPHVEGNLSVLINVEGIQCCDGVLRLAVYNNEDYWLTESGLVRGRLGIVQNESQTFEIHGLEAGQYAVVVYQDTDSDNTLDRIFGLIPREPYGFSNNVSRFGPVSFKQAAFELTEDKSISIKLKSR